MLDLVSFDEIQAIEWLKAGRVLILLRFNDSSFLRSVKDARPKSLGKPTTAKGEVLSRKTGGYEVEEGHGSKHFVQILQRSDNWLL